VSEKAVAVARPRTGAVAPNSFTARVLVAILTTAGLFYVDVIPALVIGLQDGLGFSVQQAGYVVAANVYGAAAGGLLAVFIVGRLAWRSASLVALLLLIGIDALSTQVTAPQTMLAVRLVDGLVGGVLVGIGYSIIARMQAPERTFALLLMIQFGLGGVGVFSLPQLVEQFGASICSVRSSPSACWPW
jgi:MFS transporter, DHA1 family, inner membrane transport protein